MCGIGKGVGRYGTRDDFDGEIELVQSLAFEPQIIQNHIACTIFNKTTFSFSKDKQRTSPDSNVKLVGF